jgi:RNA polymerase sigma-70 factor (ECF subfamily)
MWHAARGGGVLQAGGRVLDPRQRVAELYKAYGPAIYRRFDAQTQAVAVAVFVDGMEHEEVAQALGISRRTVARKLQRFVGNARKYLTRSTP